MTRLIYTSTKPPKAKKKPGWQQREAEYNAWLKSIGADVVKKKAKYEPYVPPKGMYVRETTKGESLNAGDTAYAARKESQQYSGDYIVGIATMHKSNLVAVGADDSPVNYSTMRRS